MQKAVLSRADSCRIWYLRHAQKVTTPFPDLTCSTPPTRPPLCNRLLHTVRHLWPHVHDGLQQIIHDFRPGVLADLLDLVQLLLRVLLRLLFGGLVAGGVLL